MVGKAMIRGLWLLTTLFFMCSLQAGEKGQWALVIHGGAGTILKKNMTEEKEKAYTAALTEALRAGEKVLGSGGTSLNAVEASIRVMEDSPLFNAGKGAVFTHDGTNELDASIMDGASLQAGAVAGVKRIKNPIALARMVMDKSKHVLLTGEGAETFAQSQGVAMTDPKYFFTQSRWDRLQQILKDESSDFKKHGTVGVVALDTHGNLAAGTSTGGLTNKMFGRVGDSPIIGAGTYADNRTCGVSATGQGEYFIRAAIAHDISALVDYKGMPLQTAVDHVIQKKLTDLGGLGGVIAMDAKGNIAWSFNTQGMYRASLKAGGEPEVRMYED